jgi:hypothetical protein
MLNVKLIWDKSPPRKTRHPEARSAHIDLADWLLEYLLEAK